MQLGASPQYTLQRSGRRISSAWIRRCSKASSRAIRSASSWSVRRIRSNNHGYFTDHMFREFATFLVEKYDSIVIDGGRAICERSRCSAALQVSAAVFLVIDAGVPVHPQCAALPRVPDAHGLQSGSDQDRGEPVSARRSSSTQASARADPADAESAGVLRHSGVARGARIDQQGPPVRRQPRGRPAIWIAFSAPSSTRRPGAAKKDAGARPA